MTFEQVFILNRALDGKDIYAMPTFAGLQMSEMSVSLHKGALIEKGILETSSSFTIKGLQINKNIQDYKNAKKYVRIMELVLGILDDSEAVMLKYAGEEYSFTLIDTKDAVNQLTWVYQFLSLDSHDRNYGMQMKPEEFLEYYKLNLNKDNSFSIMAEQGGNTTREIFFSYNNNILVYDCTKQLLCQKSRHGVERILMERMAV